MNLQLLPLAIGFSNLAMLGWLAAAAAPLLIHLWSRHRFREAPWAAMQFLLAAMRKNARRLQLQQWLLLALRTLLIVLVVLAVAEPYGERLVAGSASAPTHKVIVLDGSYSMACRHDGTTNFERAKSLAAELVRRSSHGDSVSVILMAKPPKKLFDQQHGDLQAIAAHIESLEQTHTGAELDATLALVETELATDGNPQTASWRRQVYFFTDLQRSTWAPSPSPARHGPPQAGARAPLRSDSQAPVSAETTSALQTFGSRLAKIAALHVIDVGQRSVSNVAVTRVAPAEPFVVANRDVPIDITLREFGGKPRPKLSVEFLVNGIPVAVQLVDVPANGEATLRFAHRFDALGEHALTARAAGDALEVDNTRFLVVPVREKVRVLCVEGRNGAARYVAEALSASAGVSSTIEPLVVSESGLADIDLTEFDSVFMCNVAQLTDSESTRLSNYAAEGGGIVFFLGDRVVPQSYNKFSAGASGRATASQRRSTLIPARIGESATNTQFGLDPRNYQHPIVAPFRGQEKAGLLTTPVSQYYKLELPPERRDIQVASSLHGDPFIVTASLGRGRTVLVATDASLTSADHGSGQPWTFWPTWPSFLPMIRELLAYAISGRQSDWQQLVGTATVGALPEGIPRSALSQLQVARPDNRLEPVSIDTSTDPAQWSFADTAVSGIYVLTGLPDNASRKFAFNVETTESHLDKTNPSELPSGFIVANSWQSEEASNLQKVVSTAGLHTPLLWGALALMLLESLLAWQFGKGGA